MSNIKVVVVEPQKEPYVKEIDDSLESMQSIVGGYIQVVYNYKPLLIVCDEEGKMKGYPYNRPLSHDCLVGTFFVIASDEEGEFASLTNTQVEEAIKLFTLNKPKMDISATQSIMEKTFPALKKYPMNSMTPAISSNDDKVVVSMLILADDNTIQDFINDKDGRVNIETTCYLEENKNKIGKDLVIRFDFYYPTGHPICETVIYGDLLDRQKDFVEALSKVKEIIVWIADKKRKVKKVMTVPWDYQKAYKTLMGLL